MTDVLFEIEPVCKKCGGTPKEPMQVWSQKTASMLRCNSDFHRTQQPAQEARARSTDPGTSHAAARSIKGVLRPNQDAVVAAFKYAAERGMASLCDEQLLVVYRQAQAAQYWPPQSDSGLRTRRKELADAGLVIDTGNTTRLPTGRRSILWALA